MGPKVLLAEDEEEVRFALKQGLELADFDVQDFDGADGVLEWVSRHFDGILISDIRMGDVDGMDLMKEVQDIDDALPVILITGHGDVPLAVEAMRAGAYDFIEKPFPVAKLVSVVTRALEKRRLVLENRALRQELAEESELEGRLVGRSALMNRLRAEILALADTDADVLIEGETGAGKEMVARALHEEGKRADKPFVALNCGGLPAEIIESELFGHVQGAFTGASSKRVGKLEHGNGGTVFLDEIESMPLELQVKLLRVIEDRTIEPLGTNKSISLDIRFIAATKTDLEQASKEGQFRADLFYRLNVVTLNIPPLRDRKEDIPDLFNFLARGARSRYRKEIPDLQPTLLDRLMDYDWPGNVRELRNAADRFVLGLSLGLGDEVIEPDALQANSLSERVGAYEKRLVAEELRRQEGCRTKAAEALGVGRKTLYDKMAKYGLE
ncbi:two-component system, NtrC family, C4-dicarboxylate transport response regulator DctD [Cohaesibacter gelatinilyticus]|uniref:Two-component system, NtrC family, C4-dicarboxylate transport response regulator DctD n=2 Tax=Cohaesibacter gelatinilyticus TaxID=372072 RepID=A0A285PC32_9HYPH|nr:two-component system, NtrC family, C4-dicarboxylate transport response regulator DctD [Cohaesibacter gelatinilyticus]